MQLSFSSGMSEKTANWKLQCPGLPRSKEILQTSGLTFQNSGNSQNPTAVRGMFIKKITQFAEKLLGFCFFCSRRLIQRPTTNQNAERK